MSQHLNVNGKKYLPSNELAETFGYSPDYLGKLAREEKILGTLIGRQWFIEPESLKTFLLKTEIQKKIRKEELSMQRKAEHLAHQQSSVQKVESISHRSLALAQAFVIVFCGALCGVLGWAGAEEGLQPSDLAQGAKESAAFIAASVLPNTYVVGEKTSSQFVAASAESLENGPSYGEPEPLVFTELPVFPPRSPLTQEENAEQAVSTSSTLLTGFSDEVQVIVDEEGNQLIRPVFKNEKIGSEQFLVVPVNASTE